MSSTNHHLLPVIKALTAFQKAERSFAQELLCPKYRSSWFSSRRSVRSATAPSFTGTYLDRLRVGTELERAQVSAAEENRDRACPTSGSPAPSPLAAVARRLLDQLVGLERVEELARPLRQSSCDRTEWVGSRAPRRSDHRPGALVSHLTRMRGHSGRTSGSISARRPLSYSCRWHEIIRDAAHGAPPAKSGTRATQGPQPFGARENEPGPARANELITQPRGRFVVLLEGLCPLPSRTAARSTRFRSDSAKRLIEQAFNGRSFELCITRSSESTVHLALAEAEAAQGGEDLGVCVDEARRHRVAVGGAVGVSEDERTIF